MKRLVMVVLAVAVLCSLVAATPAVRNVAAVNTYQVTGPVVEVTSDTIVVMKGKDKWELARDANTKVTGTIEKGKTVTIHYRMIANDITVKK
jgi:RNase P/RNase MRP subunit p29